MKTLTNETILVDNNVNADKLMQLTDGVSAYCGVLSKDKKTFFPFYCIESDDILTLEPDARLRYDKKFNYVWVDERPIGEIRAAYAEHLAAGPNTVANTPIFEAIMHAMSEKAGAIA